MLYFAYGSNLSSPRLMARVPSAHFHCRGTLFGYQLRYHKPSIDGSGKCNIDKVDDENSKVHGVVFSIAEGEKPALDQCEGKGYTATSLQVMNEQQQAISTFAYIATDIAARLLPYLWYKEHVLRGAREHGLPEDYIEQFINVAAMDDPQEERHRKELSIYFE